MKPYFRTWSVQKESDAFDLAKAEGPFVWDAQGNKLFDFMSGAFNLALGYKNQRVTDAITKQMQDLPVAFPNANFQAKEQLSNHLLSQLGWQDGGKVFYTLGGSEAVENALKMAQLYTGKDKVLARSLSYHGASMGSLSVTGDERRLFFNSKAFPVHHFHQMPQLGFCDKPPQVNEEAFLNHIIFPERELHFNGYDQFSCAVLEPITGVNGMVIPPENFYQFIRGMFRELDSLYISDEIFCGSFRTGPAYGFMHLTQDPEDYPDLVTISKGLTAGFAPLGAVLVKPEIAEFFEDKYLPMGLTQYAQPLSIAAALEVQKIYEENSFRNDFGQNQKTFKDFLKVFYGAFKEKVYGVRCLGMMACIDLCVDGESVVFPGRLDEKDQIALENLSDLIKAAGLRLKRKQHWLILAPPLSTSNEDLTAALEKLWEVFEKWSPAERDGK